MSFAERNALLDAVCRDGPAAALPGDGRRVASAPRSAGDLHAEILALARRGLESQGAAHEARWLEPLEAHVTRGSGSPALSLLERFRAGGGDARDLAAMLSRNTLKAAA
jgi:hypothetical protein